MLLNHVPLKCLITGASGTGKSTYFSRIIFNLAQGAGGYACAFVYDHEGEFAFRTNAAPCLSADDLTQAVESAQRLILFDPSDMFPGDVEAGFRFFAEWSFEISRLSPNRRIFCCDELQKLCTVYDLPWEFSLVIQTGRRFGLDLVCVAQQFNEIHNKLRNQITELVTFRHEEALVLDALAQKGLDPALIASLPAGIFIRKNLRDGTFEKGNVFSFDNSHLMGGTSSGMQDESGNISDGRLEAEAGVSPSDCTSEETQ